ncbi:MAG: methionine adenosyltransferase [Euryarchaeota archaeon]|nr:methionine adenosyltransferase [Euryarchaeota archaeon]
MSRRFLFSSESVTEGHPDKICDQVSDAVLDTLYSQDPHSRVACETFTSTGLVMVAGEVTTKGFADIQKIARQVLRDIGYTRAAYGIGADTCAVLSSLDEQSPDIAQGVATREDKKIGAGDQGIMFGYACDHTETYMPVPIDLAHKLTRKLAEVRKSGEVGYFRPDGKSQVAVEFEDGQPKRVDSVVIATQHDDDVSLDKIKEDVKEHVINAVIPDGWLDAKTKYYINNTGKFVRGGPFADAGLTGRKIIVDTYGGWAPHGGGAFSGKDPTKVDRSAAYAARWVAKNLVAAGYANQVQLQLAYSIGSLEPTSIHVDTRGTGKIPDEEIEHIIGEIFDLSPGGIIETLGLRTPIYRQTAAYGHFGRTDVEFPWEKLDRVEELQTKLPKQLA